MEKGSGKRKRKNILLPNSILTNAQRPNASRCSLQLIEQVTIVLLKVFVQDNVDARVFGVFGHLYRSSTDDGDLGDVWCLDHGVKHGGADEAGGAC